MLKHRLTGAAVLIGFAVVVLPLLLGGPEEQAGSEPAGQAGSEPDRNVFRSNITPIGGETPSVQERSEPVDGTESGGESTGSAVAEDGSTGSGPESSQRTASGESEGDASGATDAERDPEGSSGSEAAQNEERSVDRGWIVQVGTFKNADNVAKLMAQLEDGGFSASTSEVDTSEGSATRVWVGPYETRVEAARYKTRVKQRTGTEGLIVAYP